MLAKCYNFASKLKQNDSSNNKITFNMSTLIKFTKMHGLGNDYIYLNTMQYPIADPSALSILWSRYHTGIGSDGLVLINAGPNIIRFVPPLVITRENVDKMACILKKCMDHV